DTAGRYQFHCEPGDYWVRCEAFDEDSEVDAPHVSQGQIAEAPVLELAIQFELALYTYADGDERRGVSRGIVGHPLIVRFAAPKPEEIAKIKWLKPLSAHAIESDHEVELVFREAGKAIVEAIAVEEWEAPPSDRPEVRMSVAFNVSEATVQTVGGSVGVTL